MTEDDAKTKWCPFAVVNNGQGYNANRHWEGREDSPFRQRSLCIGSACMAWRWTQDDSTYCAGTEQTQRGGEVPPDELLRRGYREVGRHKNGEGPGANQHRDTIEWFVPGHGFCGLAGAPQ